MITRRAHWIGPLIAALVPVPFALTIRYTADFGLAYHGGLEAWSSGHPERLATWFSTPFLGLVMALVTRVVSEQLGSYVWLGANLVMWGALLLITWDRLHDQVPKTLWWGTLVAAAAFSPGISSIYWLQFNLLVFVLALGGFLLLGRHDRLAGLLIGASLATKPILLLLPLSMLIRRDTRKAGVFAIATAAALTIAGFVFLAWRAGDPAALNPLPYLSDFSAKGNGPLAACIVQNYSPVALWCRFGLPHSTLVTLGFAVIVLAAGWFMAGRFRNTAGRPWEIFCLACLLSPMVGPVQWATYQLLFAPLMLLLAYQFWHERAPRRLWIYLAVLFVMTDLVWDPVESLANAPVLVEVWSYTIAQFAQYLLLGLWLFWLRMRELEGHQVGTSRMSAAQTGSSAG
ncbi:MAG: glycosyltransferase family 87 protein [Candidatus Dormibacterales bacterium]